MGKVFRWTVLFVVLVILGSGGVALYTVFFSPTNDAAMPLLRDRSVIDAVKDAERLGFSVKVVKVVSSLPEGRVLGQEPEAGARVRKNTTVVLLVSQGGAYRPVPDVRGLAVVQAQSVIQSQGFGVGDVIHIKDESRPGGTVIAQSPSPPTQIPTDRKIDLLVNQGGAGADGRVLVPDVAQMTEKQAREILAASGLKVAMVDSIYSPNSAEGYVIGTRPAAGAAAKPGDGVRLRIASVKRPDGIPEPPITGPVGPSDTPPPPLLSPEEVSLVVTVPGHGDVALSNERGSGVPIKALDPNISVFDQPRASRPAQTQAPAPIPPQTQAAQPSLPPPPPPAIQTANLPAAGSKIAKIRYHVPPLARPLNLKIEMVDPSGKKVLLDRDAKSGEYVSLDASYSRECIVTISLGGSFVWQDKYM
ncbi:MAG: PASTA domain-containing protein [Synergistaceae bacterium]|jgi:serine/threonine-protein kinase|nr:PASTA domain-containing protein [Synergistaceae bacterium]